MTDDSKRLEQTIAELKRSLARETALRRVAEQSLKRYRESAVAGMYRSSFDGRFLRANPTMARILGYDSPEELLSEVDDVSRQHYADPVDRAAQLEQALATECPNVFEVEMVRKDGGHIHVLMDRRVVRDRHGPPLFFEGVVVDVTARKNAEQAVREQFQFMQGLIDALPNPLFYKDVNGFYQGCNKAFADMVGLPLEEVAGKTSDDVFPEGTREIVRKGNEDFFADPGVSSQEIDIPLADGSIRSMYVNRAPIVINGAFAGQVGVNTDISKVKDIQHELTKLKRAVEQSPVSIIITDTAGVIEYVNPYFCDLTGYSLEEAVGATPNILRSGHQPDEFYKKLWAAISSGREWRGQFANTKKNGDTYWEQSIISPVKDEAGNITHYIAVKEDITQRIRDERKLRRSEARYRQVVEETDNIITRVDAEGRFVFVNHAAEALLGCVGEDCLGLEAFDFIHPEDRQASRDALKSWIKERRESVSFENRILDPDGNVRHLCWSVRLHYEKDGTVRAIDSIASDVTQQKILERLREDVERITRHDLKSPLMSLISVPQVLLNADNLNETQRSLLKAAEDSGYRMLMMINLSLDLYRMEAGRYVLNPTPVDLLSVVDKVVQETAKTARQRSVEVDVRAEPGSGPVKAYGEELLCHSMLANLVTNALEASPKEGTVAITIRDGDPVSVLIHNQQPVPEAVRGCFFDKYATHGKVKGTGLGTYSARLMAQVQGGDIAMHTGEDEGTTLTVALPRVPGS